MKQFIKGSPLYSVLDRPATKTSGSFEVVRTDHIKKGAEADGFSAYSVVNPSRLQGAIFHYNEGSIGVLRSKAAARKCAEMIANEINKSEAQRKVEELAPEMLDLLLEISLCGLSAIANAKKRLDAITAKSPSNFRQQLED